MSVEEFLDQVFNIDNDLYEEFQEAWCNSGTEMDCLIDQLNIVSDKYSAIRVDKVGGEGAGDYYHMVFKFTNLETNEDTYIKYEAFYNSWDGVDWCESPVFVTPKEKTIIVYEDLV